MLNPKAEPKVRFKKLFQSVQKLTAYDIQDPSIGKNIVYDLLKSKEDQGMNVVDEIKSVENVVDIVYEHKDMTTHRWEALVFIYTEWANIIKNYWDWAEKQPTEESKLSVSFKQGIDLAKQLKIAAKHNFNEYCKKIHTSYVEPTSEDINTYNRLIELFLKHRYDLLEERFLKVHLFEIKRIILE